MVVNDAKYVSRDKGQLRVFLLHVCTISHPAKPKDFTTLGCVSHKKIISIWTWCAFSPDISSQALSGSFLLLWCAVECISFETPEVPGLKLIILGMWRTPSTRRVPICWNCWSCNQTRTRWNTTTPSRWWKSLFAFRSSRTALDHKKVKSIPGSTPGGTSP